MKKVNRSKFVKKKDKYEKAGGFKVNTYLYKKSNV